LKTLIGIAAGIEAIRTRSVYQFATEYKFCHEREGFEPVLIKESLFCYNLLLTGYTTDDISSANL